MDDFVEVAKALSDEGRVRILLALKTGELCVCQLVEFLGLAPSTVSKHMTVLKHAGLVRLRKEGRWAYYRLAGPGAPPLVRRALAWLFDSLSRTARWRNDRRRLEGILKIDKEELCRTLRAS